MQLTPKKTSITIAVSLAAGLTAAAVATANANNKETLTVEEVVVTARRRAENLQDVPIAVTAFSGETLAVRGAADITEIAQVTPSVTLEASRATNSTLTAFIRGVGQQDPLAGFEPGVALYLDDVYLARPQGALLDIYDVERIEILRGPQGTLYGRNAVGGAIKYVTRRLGDEPEARLKVAVGSYEQQDLVNTVSVPLGSMFKIGATVASLRRDGYGNNLVTGAENYNKDLRGYRISAELTPLESLLIRLAYDRTKDDSAPVAGHRPYPATTSSHPVLANLRDTRGGAANAASTASIMGQNTAEFEGWQLAVDWQLNDNFTLRSISAYREDYTKTVIDFDSLPQMDFDAPVIYDNDQTSQELQLLYNSDRLNAVAGLYYLDAAAANDFDVVLGQLNPLGITALTSGEVTTDSWSVFGDITWHIIEQLALSLGLRYTEDKRKADIFRANYLGFGSPTFGNSTAARIATTSDYEASRTFSDTSPRINLSYSPTGTINLYASYSQGWKAGSFDPRGANLTSPQITRGFEPETLVSFEVGLKATWLDNRFVTNLALFNSDYEDMQIPGSLGIDTNNDGVNDDFVGTVTNAGEANIKGLEFEGILALTEALQLQAALSRLDTKFNKYIVAGVNVANQRQVQNTPETMANIGFSYSLPVAAGELLISANWSYKDKIFQFEIPNAAIDQKSHKLFNASAVWSSDSEQWRVGLHGKNLGDEDVKTSGYCFGASAGCPSALGLEDNTTVFYGPPRTVTATLEYRFK